MASSPGSQYTYVNGTHRLGHSPLRTLHTPLYIFTLSYNITIASLVIARSARSEGCGET